MKRTSALALSLVLAACASGPSTAPLPSDVKISPPSSNLPADVKAFSGKWIGRWDDHLDHYLVVEEIEAANAIVVYSYGASTANNITPSWRRMRAAVEPGILKFTFPNDGPSVVYRLQGDGTLKGTYDRQGRISRATLTRVDR